jgi:hypothetical protein
MTMPAAARLALWEAGNTAAPTLRDVVMLGAASPGAQPGTLRGLSIGRRDARLLALYQSAFGPRLTGAFDCPACGETMELTIDVADLIGSGDEQVPSGWTSVEVDGFQVQVRLPASDDLLAAADAGDRARGILAERLLRVARDGGPVAVETLPETVLAVALSTLAELDPLVETVIAAGCPWCGGSGETLLDIGTFLWAHVQADAHRLLSEVDTLARAYGWSEAEILALGTSRRTAYLERAR